MKPKEQRSDFHLPDNPEIEKNFVCSTIHISPKDSELLEKEDDGDILVAYRHAYGWWIYAGDCKNEGQKQRILDTGLTEEFYNLLVIAYDLDCRYLCLDRDGPEYPDLTAFDWI